MLDPIKQKPIGPAEVMEKFGVTPDKLIEVQALIGDSTDNVPGVPGIGPKSAAQLINEFGDLEAVLAAAPAMKPSKRRDMLIEHAEKARISRELVTLREDAPLPLPVDHLQPARARARDARRLAGRAGLPQHRDPARPGRPPRPSPRRTAPRRGKANWCCPATRRRRPPRPRCRAISAPTRPSPPWPRLPPGPPPSATAGLVALDTETDGLDAMRARLLGISLAVAPGRACYVPLRHEGVEDAGAARPPSSPPSARCSPIPPS